MVKEIKTLIDEARAEVFEKYDVIEVVWDEQHSRVESKPGTQIQTDLLVFHKLNEGYTWSRIACYVDPAKEKFYLHYTVGNLPHKIKTEE
jgi:type III secretory pathway lipoprotein EscJ